jgi:hypothetical protein
LCPVNEKLIIATELPQAILLEQVLLEKLKKLRDGEVSLETLVNLWLEKKLLLEG